jgi:hydrogenase nickel insertion protein HypA
MHELGIAQEIYRVCRESVREHGPGRIERVRIAVGELAAVEPDLVRFAWEAVVHDGPDDGAVLDVEWCKAHQWCATCDANKNRSEGSWLRLCPDCGHPAGDRRGRARRS